jgi:hypothetical protein
MHCHNHFQLAILSMTRSFRPLFRNLLVAMQCQVLTPSARLFMDTLAGGHQQPRQYSLLKVHPHTQYWLQMTLRAWFLA